MKKYIYIFFTIAILLSSCTKPVGEIPPTPLPYLPITCDYDGAEYNINENIVLNSDGGDLIFEIKDESEPIYFSEYAYRYDKERYYNRILIQFHSYKGIDNYECDLFELKQIDEYRFNVRIFPSERTVIIRFEFNPHNCNHYYGAGLTVIVNGR